jgi:hypothetical protein
MVNGRIPGQLQCFINEDELFRSHLALFSPPAPARPGDIRAILFGRVEGLFL